MCFFFCFLNTILPINRCHLDPGLNPFLRGLSPSVPPPLSQETVYMPQLGVWEELLVSAPLNLIRAATEVDVPFFGVLSAMISCSVVDLLIVNTPDVGCSHKHSGASSGYD